MYQYSGNNLVDIDIIIYIISYIHTLNKKRYFFMIVFYHIF